MTPTEIQRDNLKKSILLCKKCKNAYMVFRIPLAGAFVFNYQELDRGVSDDPEAEGTLGWSDGDIHINKTKKEYWQCPACGYKPKSLDLGSLKKEIEADIDDSISSAIDTITINI
jgi:hypothetical protein